MSVQSALQFIHTIRNDQEARHQLADLSNPTLAAVVKLGEQAGYVFSAEDLRTAFKHDWGMRWIRYGEKVVPASESQGY